MCLPRFFMCLICAVPALRTEDAGINTLTNRQIPKVQNIDKDVKVFEYTNVTFTHAESPVWDPDTGALYWVDVLNQDVHALELNTGRHKKKHIRYGEVNVVVPVADTNRLLVCVRTQVYLMDWNLDGNSGLRQVAAVEIEKPDNILNEGKCDARGRFWAGTKGLQLNDYVMPEESALYSIQFPSHTAQVQLKPVSISNGLTWSLNNSVFYYIDSYLKKIEAFDFDLNRGTIRNRRTIIDLRNYGLDNAMADGMTIDRDGLLWVALMYDGSVIRIDPEAAIIVEQYKLPVSRVTSVAWAGANMEELVVTTSRRNLKAQALNSEPLAGALFVLHQMGTGGVPDNKCSFPGADEY